MRQFSEKFINCFAPLDYGVQEDADRGLILSLLIGWRQGHEQTAGRCLASE